MMSRRQGLSIGLVLIALITGGCTKLYTELPPPPVVEAPEPVLVFISDSQGILDYFYGIQHWPLEDVDSHLSELEKAYATQPDEALRLRLAIVLGFGRCAECKPARAMNLFKEVRDTADDGASVVLADLCIDLLEARSSIAATNKQLVKEQQIVKELQQKLNALTLIEESLHQRE